MVGVSIVPAHVSTMMCAQDGNTALMHAALKESENAVAVLLDVDGIDVNVQAVVRHTSSSNPHVPRIGALRARQALALSYARCLKSHWCPLTCVCWCVIRTVPRRSCVLSTQVQRSVRRRCWLWKAST